MVPADLATVSAKSLFVALASYLLVFCNQLQIFPKLPSEARNLLFCVGSLSQYGGGIDKLLRAFTKG